MKIFPNNVSLRQLRGFAAVAELGSFAAAARHLHITQSALSESIKQLEEALCVRLLDRTTRTVGLTGPGAVFLQEVQMALGSLEQGMRRLGELSSLAAAEVRVVAAPSVLAAVVMPCLPALRAAYPGLRVVLHEEGGDAVVRWVREGAADFGVGGWHEAAHSLSAQPLLVDVMGVLALPDDPLLGREDLSLSHLAERDVVGYTTDTAIHAILSTCDVLPASVREPVLRVSNTVLVQQAIGLGMGVAVVPALIARHPSLQGLGFRPFATPRLTRQVMVFQRPRRSLSPAAAVVLDALQLQAQGLHGWPGLEPPTAPAGAGQA